MTGRRALGRRFGWLRAAYAISAYGTGLGFGAFAMIAVLVLHSGPTQVAALAATGRAVGAVVAVPLGPWVEFRRKRPVTMGMDLIRFAALVSAFPSRSGSAGPASPSSLSFPSSSPRPTSLSTRPAVRI